MTIEQGIIEYLVPISFRLSVQQDVNAVIAFAIEGREKEDERTQYQAAQRQLGITVFVESGKHALAGRHHTDEVKTDQATEHS